MTQKVFPVLPLRDIVIFPGMVVPLFVGREKSINALEQVVDHEGQMLLVAQKDASQDDPEIKDVYEVGVLASILQMLRLPDGTVKVLVEASSRVRVVDYGDNDRYFEASVRSFDETIKQKEEVVALSRSILEAFERYMKLNKKIPGELIDTLKQTESAAKLSNIVASNLNLKIVEKQAILEMPTVDDQLVHILEVLEQEIGVVATEKKIRSRVRQQMEKSQREYYLNEQMKAIQKELGEQESDNEFQEIEKRIAETKLSKDAREKAESEFKKLKMMSPMSAEATVVRNYLDWVLDIPWQQRTRLLKDVNKAQEVLDKQHYGLDKVKERIIEYLAVQQRTNSLKGPILCLVGPPGVGKTSLAKSIAKATGRNFCRLSLGGVRDEAEIRGHRRTYIGSMPGKIIQNMKKAKSSNPLFLLDEVDKMGQDFRGDPASAMLEVLDPEQNATFNDHYLEVDYDLSDVMFVTTANTLNLPRPLLDRMEIIRLSGYTEDEKVTIATKHLMPRQLKEHGLKKTEFAISEKTLRKLIQGYTRESGVRGLDRELAKLSRKAVTELVKSPKKKKVTITEKNLMDYAGVVRFEHNMKDADSHVGVTTGLAYTEVGGDLLPIEAVMIPGGKGRISLTGQLGDVMQESAQAAWSYVRSRSHDFGIRVEKFLQNDMHIHVPEGAVPKDGPSAGCAMCTTIVSALTGIAVNRDVAMTGEISLRGMVMPIGGLKEKLLAALRGDIKKVLIPEKNVKDLKEIPDNVKQGLEIVPVSTVDQVLAHALTEKLEPLSVEEAMASLTAMMEQQRGKESAQIKH